MPSELSLSKLAGKQGAKYSLSGRNSEDQTIGMGLDYDGGGALVRLSVTRPAFPEDAPNYRQPSDSVSYPFDLADPWAGWQSPGRHVTKTLDGKYELTLSRQGDVFRLEAMRTAPAEAHTNSRAVVTVTAGQAEPSSWTTPAVDLQLDGTGPDSTFRASLRLRRAPRSS